MNQKMEKGGFPGTTRETHPEQPDSRHATSNSQDTKGMPTAARTGDTVTVSRDDYERLRFDALCWRRWWDPDVIELRAEQVAWSEREKFRTTSSAVSAGADWSAIASAPSHAELIKRRAEPVVPRRCGERDCRALLSVPWPAPTTRVYCPRHQVHEHRRAA